MKNLNYRNHLSTTILIFIFLHFCFLSIGTNSIYLQTNIAQEDVIPGDADGNGIVDMDDARIVARYVSGQIEALPSPENADVTQDGEITIDDGFTIAQRVSGNSRIVITGPKDGFPDRSQTGTIVRIEVFEKFYPHEVISGTVRIISQTTGYDSGDQPLTFERDGKSLYYNWYTGGLNPTDDYKISVSINESEKVKNINTNLNKNALDFNVDFKHELDGPIYHNPHLTQVQEAYAPAPGIPLTFQRTFHSNYQYYPYLGPLGRGWWHNFDIRLEEETDGSITFLNQLGNSRVFHSNPDGIYTASPGDYGQLFRDADGTFQLKEKNGLIYHFSPLINIAKTLLVYIPILHLDFIEDTNGNIISATYNSANQLIKVQHSNGSNFRFEYNSDGRISKLIDNVGRETIYEYDGYGTHLIKVTAPGNKVTEYTFSLGQGEETDHRLSSILLPDTVHQYFTYDTKGRISTISGSWGLQKMSYSYETDGTTHISDELGNETLIKVNDKDQPVWTQAPDGGITRMEYNNASNLTGVTDPLGNQTLMGYDEFGNVTKTTDPLKHDVNIEYDLRFNKPYKITNQLGITTENWYDDYGNLKNIVYIDESKETFTYDAHGNMLTSEDGEGKKSTYTYNNNAQLTSLKNASGNTTQFSYDSKGQLNTVTNAKGTAVVKQEYDEIGRVTKKIYSDNTFERYTYNSLGNVTSFTNRRGETLTYKYNLAGQLEWKYYPNGKAYHYYYNLAGILFRIERVEGGITYLEEEFELDANQRVVKSKTPGKQNPETYDISYAYDLAGNRTLMAYADGYILHYEYDALNRLVRIYDDEKTIVAYEYDAAGRRTKRTLGNGTYTEYGYNAMNYLTELTNYAPGGTVQSSFKYDYNKAGMRQSMTSLEGLHTYEYDDTYQLTSVTYPNEDKVDYRFDAVGNRISVTENGNATNYTTNNLDQYINVGDESLTYDKNGNLTKSQNTSETTTYIWNADDRLVGVNKNGIQINYEYDYQGRLISKTVNGNYVRYIWDKLDLIAEMDANGNLKRRYIYGNSIDEIILVIAEGNNFWCQLDGLRSVIGTTNNFGQILEKTFYDVYGNFKTGIISNVPQRFAGMIWDEQTHLYYVRARWYSAGEGSFLSFDPIGLAGGNTNCYQYVDNSPINSIDPYGLASLRKYSGLGWPHKHFFFDNNIILNLGNLEIEGDNIGFYPEKAYGDWSGSFGNNAKIKDYGKIIKDNLNDIILKRAIEDTGWPPDWIPFIYDCDDWSNQVLDRYEELMGKVYIMPDGTIQVLDYIAGMCPTFIQPKNKQIEKLDLSKIDINSSLIAEMPVPSSEALLRSDIPIYGLAGGNDFKQYRVEYGRGREPTKWHLIEKSNQPQMDCPEFKDISWMQGDIDLKGNLATWNVGLKNWSHLPWHAPEDTIDLNGVYTIRLTVEGKDGKTIKQTTCEVGRVIAQCLPGIAISPDKKVTMRFSEQALTNAFRVYTIIPLKELEVAIPNPPASSEYIGEVYRFREPGDRFSKAVTLEFSTSNNELPDKKPENIGIIQYDATNDKWNWISTEFIVQGNDFVFKTKLFELPTPKAIYALAFHSSEKKSKKESGETLIAKRIAPISKDVLVYNTFDEGPGSWKERDKFVGALIALDNTTTPDGSNALKIINDVQGGNFSVTALEESFDVKNYPIMSFDYRLAPGVKSDFYLLVNNRWYNIGFTDDPIDFRNQDVNIANLGRFETVYSDNNWHSVSINLYEFLRRKTKHTQIDAIIMADWDVGGYMKLEFGNNARGATYYIDNFKLSAGPDYTLPEILVFDDFNSDKSTNLLGGSSGTFSNAGTNYLQADIIEDENSGRKKDKNKTNNILSLTYETNQENAYCGYWSSLQGKDLAEMNELRFKIKSSSDIPDMLIGIRHAKQAVESAVNLDSYISEPDPQGWFNVSIPLFTFVGSGLPDLKSLDVLFFKFENKIESGNGTIYIDDIQFSKETDRVYVYDFYKNASDINFFGGESRVIKNEAVAIAADFYSDYDTPEDSVLRISYGGNIGLSYGGRKFSYAMWETDILDFDASKHKSLVIKLKGQKGGEQPNIYLADGATRRCLRPNEFSEITTDWQEIKLPLQKYADLGIDLTHLEKLQFTFEWEEMSGTIYIDKIYFED